MDIVVTVPKNFRYGNLVGLRACYTMAGLKPEIEPGERVYVVCEGMLVGYAPLVEMRFTPTHGPRHGKIELWRAGGAVACTINEKIIGFRGWRKRWWNREDEFPLDLSPWIDDSEP